MEAEVGIEPAYTDLQSLAISFYFNGLGFFRFRK